MDIPKFRYPFDGSFPVSLSFAAQSENQEIKDKFTQWGWSGHIGLDFGCPEGAQILSVDSGEVIQSGGNGDYGESVTVKHSWGTTLYAHLQQTSVKVGDSVSAGQPLGLSGHSGSAFGDHLHFAVLPSEPDSSNGFQGYVDPTPYLQKTAPEPVQVKEVIKEVPVEKVVEKEVVKEIKVIDQAEVDRQVQEKLKQNLDANCQKANQVRKQNRQDNLDSILKLATSRPVTNDLVRDLLHVSQSTASEYLSELVSQDKLKDQGKAKAIEYIKL